MIKRVFSDMDGTLLNHCGMVSDENAHLIKTAGIPMTLVSARAPMEMQAAVRKLDLKGVQIGFNGGLIYRVENEQIVPLYTKAIEQDDVYNLLENLTAQFPEVTVTYYSLEKWYAKQMNDALEFEKQNVHHLPEFVASDEAFLRPNQEIFKIKIIVLEEALMNKLHNFVLSLNIEGISVQESSKNHLEITHKLAKKSFGIDYIMREEELSEGEVAAFGDGKNDLPMFERTNFGIAMANANQELLKKARFITLKNDYNGVGYGIHKFLRKI